MRGLEAPGPRPAATPCGCVKPSLETGNLLTEPIGYLESCFLAKNGTPRQPSICSHSRACLRIRKSIFNNPEHSLMGLEQFSHVWILFVFHKNGHLSYKAKVQPPRLNGAKTGVFSTRSPHRPNAIGLTLAKLENVEGWRPPSSPKGCPHFLEAACSFLPHGLSQHACSFRQAAASPSSGAIYLSGIDMIHGTPVLDIKPYIADYDSPQNLMETLADCNLQNNQPKPKTVSLCEGKNDSYDQRQLSGYSESQPHCSTEEKPKCPEDRTSEETYLRHDSTAEGQQTLPKHRERAKNFGLESIDDQSPSVAQEQIVLCGLENSCTEEGTDEGPKSEEGAAGEAAVLHRSSMDVQPEPPPCGARTDDRAPSSVVPSWVREAPVAPLQVRFTPHAEKELGQLGLGGEPGADQASFRYFQSAEEARRAIEAVLAADPRSVYRRKLCQDRLFYFTVDTAHVTCWFGDGFAEVLKIKPFLGPCS